VIIEETSSGELCFNLGRTSCRWSLRIRQASQSGPLLICAFWQNTVYSCISPYYSTVLKNFFNNPKEEEMKSARASSKLVRLFVATLLALSFLATSGSLSAGVAHAEGSRDLYPATLTTGFRANIEWRTSYYGPSNFLLRRTLLQVYAEPGEVLLIGSSAVGVGAGDILLYSSDQVSPPIGDETVSGLPDFSCVTDQPGRGQITSRALELAGPQSADGTGNLGGYVPCFFTVPPGGSANNIYYVAFIGPSGANADIDGSPTTGELDLASPANFDASQNTSISAWDVTVRSSLTSTADITGRLFGDYLSMITGSVSRPMDSTLTVLTTDSYIYQVDLRGLDPYGFIVYSNDRGFLNTDGTPLLQDVLADPTIPTQQQNQLNALVGGVSAAAPTHHVFFNEPSAEARLALNGLVDPVAPSIDSFVFNGVLFDNNTLVGAGGTFDLAVNVRGIYQLVISQDGVDFDPNLPTNRALIGVGSAGPQQIAWDGLDNAGTPFPVGLDYPARILLRAGEVHFPLLDVESSQQGGPTYVLTNPPAGCPPLAGGCFTGFYDDRGYTTANGADVGVPGVPLPGTNPPPVPNSDPLLGFDTRSADRAFGDGSAAGFGDKKGLDLWSYYPAEGETTLNIFAEAPPTPTPTPTSTPTPTLTPTPTSPPDGGNGDDGDGKKDPTPTPRPPTSVTTPVPAPAPTPAVLLLPETGVGYAKTVPMWPLIVLPGLGLLIGWVVYRRRQ
jgi:hypothetical protein